MSQLTFLPLDSPANPLALPGSAQASKMTVTSGRKLCALFRKPDPVGYLARTCLASSVWHSMTCWLRWNVRATPQRRLLYQLAPSTPHTNGIASGLLPTPKAQNANAPGIHGNGGQDLQTVVAIMNGLFPTPRANSGVSRTPGTGGKCLQEEVRHLESKHGKLNPEFVEWLMGYPIGWSDCADSETP